MAFSSHLKVLATLVGPVEVALLSLEIIGDTLSLY